MRAIIVHGERTLLSAAVDSVSCGSGRSYLSVLGRAKVALNKQQRLVVSRMAMTICSIQNRLQGCAGRFAGVRRHNLLYASQTKLVVLVVCDLEHSVRK